MTEWDRACTALKLLALDPTLGGIHIRARVGPVRDRLLQMASTLPGPHVRLHPTMTADVLDDGIDLTATLSNGSVTMKQGLLQRDRACFTLTMAERCDPYLAARLADRLDAHSGQTLLALDEGVDDETIPPALTDRLAFHVSLDGLAQSSIGSDIALPDRAKHITIDTPDTLPEQLVTLAVRLGISGLRAPAHALRCAKAHASLQGRQSITEDDVSAAVALVYAHRATVIPQDDEQPADDPLESQQPPPSEGLFVPDDILRDAVKSALPAGLLEKLESGSNKGGSGSGSGKKKIGNRRGRPLPARGNRSGGKGRIDLIATLRAAIPWQTLRKRDRPDGPAAMILPTDLRHKRYEDTSDRLLIFAVDASGSAAMARLGEAKGAVELLLAEAYARRDHVALISFRGTGAEVLLPPTRSLVQTKRRLASLPGGGGTPLAAGLQAAADLAATARQKGLTPTIVLLTDGRSNIALDGSASRELAANDVSLMTSVVAKTDSDAIVIDTGKRPEQSLKRLAQTLAAPYIALPRADAQKLSEAVQNSLGN